jgi:hypothetical protein
MTELHEHALDRRPFLRGAALIVNATKALTGSLFLGALWTFRNSLVETCRYSCLRVAP